MICPAHLTKPFQNMRYKLISAAAPRLCPLQLLLPDCVCFSCFSPIASASVAAPHLCLLQLRGGGSTIVFVRQNIVGALYLYAGLVQWNRLLNGLVSRASCIFFGSHHPLETGKVQLARETRNTSLYCVAICLLTYL